MKFNVSANLKVWAAAAAALTTAACGSDGVVGARRGAGDSELTAINIELPSRDGLKTQVSDIESKMNGYHFKVTPVDASCAEATKVDQVADYQSSASIGASLRQGCDYDISLALGNKSSTQPSEPQTTSAPSYNGAVKTILDRNCISCHGGSGGREDLSTYAAAKAAGSEIIRWAVTNGTMPTSGPLSDADKKTLKEWADGGYLERDGSSQSGGSSPASLGAIYYKNTKALRVSKEDIAGKAAYKVSLPLQLQDAGRAIGLGGSDANPNAGGSSLQPESAEPSVQIPAERDFEVTDASGAAKMISGHFKGEYMLLDFSSSTCAYCLQRAREMNASQALQQKLSGGKCSHATIVPADDLSNWHRAIGASSFMAQHSYQAKSGNIGRLATNFGIRFGGTPTFILIDSQGRVLADSNGIPTAEINRYCQ